LIDNETVPDYECNLLYRNSAQNAWALCVSARQDDRFYDWPDNDCCIEIFDERFFVEIAQGINDRAPYSVLAKCGYASPAQIARHARKNRFAGIDGSACMNLIKAPSHAWQHEVRFIAEPYGVDREAYNRWGQQPFMTLEEELNQAFMFPHLARTEVYAPGAAQYTRLVGRKA